MSQRGSQTISAFSRFFEKAVERTKPAYAKVLMVLSVVVLLAVAIPLAKGCGSKVELIGIVSVLAVAIALLVCTLHYLETKLQYSATTVEVLKSALREEVAVSAAPKHPRKRSAGSGS